MVDILIFVYENFFASGIYPTNAVLQNRLFAAGFNEAEVEAALAWLDNVDNLGQQLEQKSPGVPALRCLDPSESEKLGAEGWGFLLFLETNQILTPLQREWILASVMALDHEEVDFDRLKLIVLMVLWRQGQPLEAMLVEELIHYQDRVLQ